jgi:serine phosphatase RsbU (regulator of sigma subunit)
LLPARAPRFPGFDIAGACHPAEQCSGDFFDYIPLSNRRLALILADVSGHGFGPAILAATIRSYLRTAAVLGNQVHEMLALGNRLLASDGEATPFASVFCVCLYADSRALQFTSAGHPGYLVRRNGQNSILETECVPIGVRDNEAFPLSRAMRLHRGDILLMASDGLFEARRNHDDFFGVERALQVVRDSAELSAAEIVKRLHDAACEFSGSSQLEDDVTVVIAKAVARPAAIIKDTTKWVDQRPGKVNSTV